MDKPLVIWHAGCLDGFVSAYIVWEAFDEKVELFPGKYQEAPPLEALKERDVIIVDFSYKKEPMRQIVDTAHSVLVLDHHKTAEEELREWIKPFPAPHAGVPSLPFLPTKGCVAHFDMERSGAGLTWDFFFSGRPRPLLVNAVEDRDLWRFEKAFTKELNAALYSMKFDPDVFRNLFAEAERNSGLARLIDEGGAILRQEAKNRAALIREGQHQAILGGIVMPIVNAPWWMASEIGNELATSHDCKCGATYFIDKDGYRTYSLRSIEGGPDVSEIAKQYGGGGHKHAAGFRHKRGV